MKDKSEDSLAYTNKFLEVHSDLPHNINPPDVCNILNTKVHLSEMANFKSPFHVCHKYIK